MMKRTLITRNTIFCYNASTETTNLTNAVTCTGEAYEEIAKLVDDQPRNDWEHLGDTMHDYRGILAGWPGIMQIHAVSTNELYT